MRHRDVLKRGRLKSHVLCSTFPNCGVEHMAIGVVLAVGVGVLD